MANDTSYLLIYAHPNPKSFNAAVRDVVVKKLESMGGSILIRDLYAIGFRPASTREDFARMQHGISPDVAEEQAYIKSADVIIFIHPIWWFGMPAILKGYIDRVFSYGFAYASGKNGVEGLLNGKKVMVFNTTGGDEANYIKNGYADAIRKQVDVGTFGFCGMDVVMRKFLYGVPFVGDEGRKKMLEELDGMELGG